MSMEATGVLTRFTLELGRITILAAEILRSLCTVRPNFRDVLTQMHFIGVKSQWVVLITGSFAGMVLCAQTYYQFQRLAVGSATLAVVSAAMCSELGPVLAGLMVAGRVGAAITAQLGTMRVTEQIDALRTMATHPVDYLVVPRVLAAVLVMPMLTSMVVTIGLVSAYLLGVSLLGMDSAYSIKHAQFYSEPFDVFAGLFKSIFFGGVIAWIGCYKGLNCRGGAEGVGRATNEAVVQSCITILILNFFLTLILRQFR